MAQFASSYRPSAGVPIAEMASRVTRPQLRAARRMDVFWELAHLEWSQVWNWRAAAELYVASGRRLPGPYDLSVSKETAMGSLWDRRQSAPWPVRLRILAAIYHWKALTTEQVAALVGTNSIRSDLMALWQAGLVRRGGAAPKVFGASVPDVELWKIDWDANVRPLLKEMTPWERYGLLSGTDWAPRAVNTMHDLIVVDTTLRVAELAPSISAVYGEELSRATRLTNLPPSVARQARGDAVWVRSDGLRIVVEVSVAPDKQSLAKAERWARVLEAHRPGDLFVLFLVGTHPQHRSKSFGWALNAHRRAVANAAWSSLSSVQARVPERMGVAALADWAPAPLELAPGFPRLPVWRPTGPPDDRFEPANLGDSYDVVFDGEAAGPDALAPIAWAPLAYSMPRWIAKEALPLARQYLAPVWQLGLPKPRP